MSRIKSKIKEKIRQFTAAESGEQQRIAETLADLTSEDRQRRRIRKIRKRAAAAETAV